MIATIITIGDELLIGQVVDTNSAWLGSELTKVGFHVEQIISISDKDLAIREALTIHLQNSDLIVFSGGLGPTKDDITKNVLADYFNSPLVFSEDVLKDVESFIALRGSKMNQLNRDQALFPEKAQCLPNKQGTAAGMWFEKDNKVVISVPGVPSEMKGIFKQYALSRLQNHFNLPQVLYKTVLINGIAEALLAEKLEEWERRLSENISLAYLPSPGLIRLRLGVSGSDGDNLIKQLETPIRQLDAIIPGLIFGYDKDTLASVIGKKFLGLGATLSTAESCTGGNIAHSVTLESGCSEWYKGSIVAYNNEVKQGLLGVDKDDLKEHGAVSQKVVEQMAIGVKKVLRTDYSIATSGIAGPLGGSDEKPIGTVWVAVAGPNFVFSKLFMFGKDRAININNASMAALAYLNEKL